MQRTYVTFGSKPKTEAFPCVLPLARSRLPLFLGSWKPTVLLCTIFVSIFVAGAFDVAFSDVIPVRPYDSFFRSVITFNSGSNDFVVPILFIVAVLFIVSCLFGVPLISLTQKAASHASHRRTADRHKSPSPLRNTIIVSQPSDSLEKLVRDKKAEFARRYPTKKKQVIGDEILWQD